MPKKPINYDNTIIYKLCCKDPTINKIYIGHTTNFIKRKQQHKSIYNNINQKEYNSYKYHFIRNNGGWDNWCMIEIIKLKCMNIYDALRVERQYIEQLKATLNMNRPIILQIEKDENLKRPNNIKCADKIKNFLNKDKINNFLNMVNIINFKQDTYDNNDINLDKLPMIKNLLSDLGFKNIYDRETKINNDELLEKMEHIKNNNKIFKEGVIKTYFNSFSSNKNIFHSCKSFLGFVNSLFNNYGFKIVCKQIKRDCKRIYIYNLEFIEEVINIINKL